MNSPISAPVGHPRSPRTTMYWIIGVDMFLVHKDRTKKEIMGLRQENRQSAVKEVTKAPSFHSTHDSRQEDEIRQSSFI